VASRIASLAARAPRAILLLSGVLALALGAYAIGTPDRLGLGGGAPAGSESEEASATLTSELGYEPIADYQVVLTGEDEITSPSSGVAIDTVTSQIMSIDGVEAVTEGAPSEDGLSTTLAVHMSPDAGSGEIADAGEALASSLDPGGLEVEVAGPAAVGDGARDTVLDAAPALVLLVLPLLLLLLGGSLGLRPALVALLGAVLAVVAATTAVGLLGIPFDLDAISLAAAIPLAAVLAIESSAGLLYRYREESATLGAGAEALEYSLHVVLRGAAIAMFSAALIGVALFAVPIGWLQSVGAGILVAAILAPPLALLPMGASIAMRSEAEVGTALPLVAEGARPERASPVFRLFLGLGRGRSRGLVAILPLIAIAVLALPLRDDAEAVGLSGAELPADEPAAKASSTLAEAFGPGAAAPIIVLTDGPAEAPTVTIYRDAISRLDSIESVGLALSAGLLATFDAQTVAASASLDAQDAVTDVRESPSPSPRKIGGGDAQLLDSADRMSGDLALVALVALLGTAALWSLLFRSAFGPLLALAAAIAPLAGLGAIVAVFGKGRLQDLFDYASAGGLHIETYVVVGATLLAIGLARGAQTATALREERELGGGPAGSLARAGVLTLMPAAAASLVGIVLAGVWAGSELLAAQEIGLGLAVGLLADLVLTRLLLAPALARLSI
jgi:putative drug exporter of the RND superfamily